MVNFFDVVSLRLRESAEQLNGRSDLSSGKLPVMQEAHPWQSEDEQGRRTVFCEIQSGGDAVFIMVFQEMSGTRKPLGRHRQQVLLDYARLPGEQQVQQFFVVGIIETKFL